MRTLELKLQKTACRRKNPRYYAVWVRFGRGAGGEARS
jgi:hypothetical protein